MSPPRGALTPQRATISWPARSRVAFAGPPNGPDPDMSVELYRAGCVDRLRVVFNMPPGREGQEGSQHDRAASACPTARQLSAMDPRRYAGQRHALVEA
jgi:hypothetical protein